MSTNEHPPEPSRTKRPVTTLLWLGLAGFVLVGGCTALVIAAANGGDDDNSDADEQVSTERSTTTATAAGDELADADSDEIADGDTADNDTADDASSDDDDDEVQRGDEQADVTGCTVLDDSNIRIDLTNNSSKTSSYFLDVVFRDDSGERVGDEPSIVNHVRPGEQVSETSFVFDMGGGATCEIVDVNRSAAESPDDLDEVTCTVTGEDALGDIAAEIVAINGSSRVSTYSISAALVRDGVRIGHGSALIENVGVDEAAPDSLFTTTDGPSDGVSCEVAHVDRTFSGEAEGDGSVIGEGSETDDITECSIIDENTIRIGLTNNSSKTSSYTLNVVFRDGAGDRVGDEITFISNIRTNEIVSQNSYVFDLAGASSCEVASVDRVADESPNDIAEASCTVQGVDALDHIEAIVTVTNPSSETSDYQVELALVRNGTRVGGGNAAASNVSPGESAPADAFTIVDGPADGVVCEPVSVNRVRSG